MIAKPKLSLRTPWELGDESIDTERTEEKNKANYCSRIDIDITSSSYSAEKN